jgi:hypothetical protein
MRIRNHRDFWAGAMFIVIGALYAGFSLQYEVGSGARMGPGYFPLLLGILLAVLGVIVAWQSTVKSALELRVASIGWRELFLVLGAVAVFGFTLPWLGMVVAIALMILIASFASHEFTWKTTIMSILVLLVMSYLVFVKGLELQFPVWPTFLTA